MSKHTPGPWTIATSADRTPLVMSKDVSVAHIFMQRTPVGRLPKSEETNANARLIAAAPDLLEACIAYMADRAEAGCKSDPASVKRMRSAIAKATGEAA